MSTSTLSDAVKRCDADSIVVFGKTLKYLTVASIKECLGLMLESFNSTEFDQCAEDQQYLARLAQFEIYTKFRHVLSDQDFTAIVYPFLLERDTLFAVISETANPKALLRTYYQLWQFSQAHKLDQFSEMDGQGLYNAKCYLWAINDIGQHLVCDLESGNAQSIREIGDLFDVMGMSEQISFFETWIIDNEKPEGYIEFFLGILQQGHEEALDAYTALIRRSASPQKVDYLAYIGAAKIKYDWEKHSTTFPPSRESSSIESSVECIKEPKSKKTKFNHPE